MEKRMCGCGVRPKSKEERNVELRRDAARIVAGVESYSGADRMRRGAEVRAAFPPVKSAIPKATAPKVASKTISKPAAKKTVSAKTSAKIVAKKSAKSPTPAGMSTGPHDGDIC